jgi:hypothetical protein
VYSREKSPILCLLAPTPSVSTDDALLTFFDLLQKDGRDLMKKTTEVEKQLRTILATGCVLRFAGSGVAF